MKKILSLTTKDFLTGISPSSHLTNAGLFVNSEGINPYVNPSEDSSQTGLLQTCSAPTQVDSSDITDAPLASVSHVTSAGVPHLYMITVNGKLYDLDLSTGQATDLRAGNAISNPRNGMVIHGTSAGTSYLYYTTAGAIGRWDLSGTYPTGWNDSFFSTMSSSTNHFMHIFNDEVYITDRDQLDKIDGAGTASSNVLDFPFALDAQTLEDDGTYLIIGATKNSWSANNYMATTKIMFWDRQSTSWNKEYTLPEPNIVGLKRVGDVIYALTTRGLYAFNFNTAPIKVLSLPSSDNTIGFGHAVGYPGMIDRLNDAVVWSSHTALHAFGKIHPNGPRAHFKPWAGSDDSHTFVNCNAQVGKIFAGTYSGKLYSWDLTTGGGIGFTAETIFLPLGDTYRIDRVDLTFGEPLASGDSLNLDLQSDADTSVTDYGTASFAVDGAIRYKKFFASTPITSDQIKLKLNFDAGNVKIKRIDIYGEPVER